MPKDFFDYQYELLLKEVDILQSAIREYDKTLFTIKGWAITIFSAFVFFIAEKGKPELLGLAALSMILFWVLDAIYKSFQRRFIYRYLYLEAFLRTGLAEALKIRTMPITLPDVRYEKTVPTEPLKVAVLDMMRHWNTSMLYVAMLSLLALLGLASAIL